ncbi:MAG: PilZ domain-containing protein [Oscillospiraceae bacterium]|nr:PilZ domain-containing protein [Oscillospiraceae bacterium]
MPNMPIEQDYAESVCEIKTMDNLLMAIGKVKEVTDKYVKLYSKKKELRIMNFGEALKVNIFNTKLGFKVIVGNVYTSTRGELSMINISVLTDRERRNFFRVDMELYAKVIYRKRGPSKEADVKVLDMSLSGLRFKSELEFSQGSIVSLVLKLTPNGRGMGKEFTFPCEIVRIIPNEDENMFQYGCRYTGDNADSSDALCSFLFKKQRESLNNQRN